MSAVASDRVAINPKDGTHESLCSPQTRMCWIEFSASLSCLVLGLVCVLSGASVDSSAIGPNAGRSDREPPAGPKVATYIGVFLLVAGGALLITFGVHFYLVKRRLDLDKFSRFARLGIRPASRYSALPEENAAARHPRLSVVTSAAPMAPSPVATGTGFYCNLGFSSDGPPADTRPPADADGRRSSAATTTSSSGIGSSGSPAGSSLAMAIHLPPFAQPLQGEQQLQLQLRHQQRRILQQQQLQEQQQQHQQQQQQQLQQPQQQLRQQRTSNVAIPSQASIYPSYRSSQI